MAYDHSKKIGNQGDVAKHAILAAVADYLLQKHKGGPFRYVEAHSGRAEYILPEGGAWKQGIGKLSSENGFPSNLPKSLRPYADACFDGPVTVGQRYWGSAGIVFRMVLKKNIEPEFFLYETEPLARADLVRYFRPWPRVCILNEDGYQGVLGVNAAHLVLLDPPDLTGADRLIEAMKHLTDHGIPFICWTPRNGNTGGNEVDRYVTFRDKVKSEVGVDPFLFRWHDWHSRVPGCCVHVYPNDLFDVAKDVARALRWLLSWDEV